MFELKKGDRILVFCEKKPIGFTKIERITKTMAITTDGDRFKKQQDDKNYLRKVNRNNFAYNIYHFKLIDNDDDYKKYSKEIKKIIYFNRIKIILKDEIILENMSFEDIEQIYKILLKNKGE